MNFDFGEILTRAGQITWKHKALWLFSALPTLLSIIIVPLVFVPFILTDWDQYGTPQLVENPFYIVIFISGIAVISILSFILYGISCSSVTLGVLRAEGGEERLGASELFNDGRTYWWRILGVMLLIGVAFSLVIFLIFGCMSLLGVLTMGLGFICLQPLFLLIYPLSLALYGIIEESQAAVVVDDLGVTDAIQRGWELVKANFWRILLISFIVYFAISLLGGLVAVPFMIPFFFIPFFMDGSSAPDMRTIMLITGGITLLMIPVMALVQGVGMTFLKAAYTIVYLRLTKPGDEAPVPIEANA